MRRAIRFALCAAVVFALWGCSDEDVVNPTELEPPPTLDVTGRALDGGSIDLSWGSAVGEFIGYRIYAHTTSIRNLTTTEALEPYVILDNLGSAEYTATVYLPNSFTYYYIHVRAFTDGGDVSAASPELHVIARPQGESVVIYEFDSTLGNDSGFDMSTGETISLGADDRHDRVDFFLGYSGGLTGTGLFLWDPKKANQEYDNTTRFTGWTGSFDDLVEVPLGATYLDNIEVTGGKVLALRITDEYGITHYGKLQIVSVGGVSPDRTITLRWAYQPEPDRPELVPQP